ncbi:MAG TPA: MBL fold metallo-hydrolase [Steroidobacteraceae bacterium]|nr:MBL fold metallo-hydrolase [Steroidobacteraceae bacterium]
MAERSYRGAWLAAGRVLLLLLVGVKGGAFAQPATDPATKAAAPVRASLQVQQLRPGLNVVLGAGGNVVVWSGPEGVVLLDSGLASRAAELFETVARIAPGDLRFVINTHGHVDHSGGNAAAAQRGAVLIGHESLRDWAGRDAAVPAEETETGEMLAGARPIVTTTDTLALHLNGDRLDVLHVADAHTASDLVARWQQADVIALGDLYWNGQYPHVDAEAGGSLAGIVAAVEAALARSNARTLFVPGHGPVSNRAELAVYRDMLVTVGRKVREAVEQGEGLEQVLATHPTAEFDARYARPGALVSPEQFVRNVYADFTRK